MHQHQVHGAANRQKVAIETVGEISGLANLSDDAANENPGATAIATGAKDVLQGVCLSGEYIAAFPILAMHWGTLV